MKHESNNGTPAAASTMATLSFWQQRPRPLRQARYVQAQARSPLHCVGAQSLQAASTVFR